MIVLSVCYTAIAWAPIKSTRLCTMGLLKMWTNLDPWLVVQMADVELSDWRMWQHLVMLLQDLVKALQPDTTNYFKLLDVPSFA